MFDHFLKVLYYGALVTKRRSSCPPVGRPGDQSLFADSLVVSSKVGRVHAWVWSEGSHSCQHTIHTHCDPWLVWEPVQEGVRIWEVTFPVKLNSGWGTEAAVSATWYGGSTWLLTPPIGQWQALQGHREKGIPNWEVLYVCTWCQFTNPQTFRCL